MRVVVVVGDSFSGRFFLSRLLHNTGAIDRVVVEAGREPWRFYWRKLKRVGLVNFVAQFIFSRRFEGNVAHHTQGQYNAGLDFSKIEKVESVNSLDLKEDDLVLCYGTTFVRGRTLRKARFLNLHTGILPLYRGVKSEWWVFHNSDFDNAGFTLHEMTTAYDRGAFILREKTPVLVPSPPELRVRILEQAAHSVGRLLDNLSSSGPPAATEIGEAGHYYTTPTLKEMLGLSKEEING